MPPSTGVEKVLMVLTHFIPGRAEYALEFKICQVNAFGSGIRTAISKHPGPDSSGVDLFLSGAAAASFCSSVRRWEETPRTLPSPFSTFPSREKLNSFFGLGAKGSQTLLRPRPNPAASGESFSPLYSLLFLPCKLAQYDCMTAAAVTPKTEALSCAKSSLSPFLS